MDATFDWLRFVDATFSTYFPDSELSRVNRGELLLDARAAGGGGAGDRRDPSVRVPGALDPSGRVKGWSVERAGKILATRGAGNYSVNAGGGIRTRGAALPAPTWRIGIQHPQHGDATAAFAMGLDGPDWTATLHGYDALTILADGRMLSTRRFPFAVGAGAPLHAAGTRSRDESGRSSAPP